MNVQTSITVVGLGQFRIASTFIGSICTSPGVILQPRKTVFQTQNSLLSLLTESFYTYSVSSTCFICFLYSSRVFEKIRMLSRQQTMNLSRQAYIVQSTMAWKVAGVFISLNGIVKYSKCLYRVLKAVFYSSLALMRTQVYAIGRSSYVKQRALASRSLSQAIRGKGYLFFTVSSFNCRQSTYIWSLLSFLGIKRMGYPAGDFDGLICPIFRFFLIQLFNSLSQSSLV